MYIRTCNVCHNIIEDNTPYYESPLEYEMHIHPDCLGKVTPVELANIVGLYMVQPTTAIVELPLHRTQTTLGIICSTCEGGGCPDCTDPT